MLSRRWSAFLLDDSVTDTPSTRFANFNESSTDSPTPPRRTLPQSSPTPPRRTLPQSSTQAQATSTTSLSAAQQHPPQQQQQQQPAKEPAKEPAKVKCPYSSARGNCTQYASGYKPYCAAHACPKDGCKRPKGSRDRDCGSSHPTERGTTRDQVRAVRPYLPTT